MLGTPNSRMEWKDFHKYIEKQAVKLQDVYRVSYLPPPALPPRDRCLDPVHLPCFTNGMAGGVQVNLESLIGRKWHHRGRAQPVLSGFWQS